jgi:pyruvate formate lyase activating enzyme
MEACPHGAITPDGRLISPGFETCRSCVTRECIEACNSEALSLSGEVVTSDYVVDRVSADIPFYRNSGGGVTVSGGEPLAQPAFLAEILSKCRGKGIHTAVETCGWADENALSMVLPFTDLLLFDLKIADPELHLHYTGKPVGPVLLNLALAASVGVPVIIRLPLIPGITDTLPNLEGIARIMAQNRLETIHLLSYHTLGEEKYAEHGLVSSMPVTAPYGKEKLQEIMNFFVSKGYSCSS